MSHYVEGRSETDVRGRQCEAGAQTLPSSVKVLGESSWAHGACAVPGGLLFTVPSSGSALGSSFPGVDHSRAWGGGERALLVMPLSIVLRDSHFKEAGITDLCGRFVSVSKVGPSG